jgi:preprotein translocase subunit SecB
MEPDKQPGIRFEGVDLVSLSFAVEAVPRTPISYGISFGCNALLSEDKKALDVFLTTDLFGRLPENERPPIKFVCVVHGRFVAGEAQIMALQEFARHHAPGHLYPYVREIIASITSRSSLPTLNIGPINVIALIDSGEASFELDQKPKPTQDL